MAETTSMRTLAISGVILATQFQVAQCAIYEQPYIWFGIFSAVCFFVVIGLLIYRHFKVRSQRVNTTTVTTTTTAPTATATSTMMYTHQPVQAYPGQPAQYPPGGAFGYTDPAYPPPPMPYYPAQGQAQGQGQWAYGTGKPADPFATAVQNR